MTDQTLALDPVDYAVISQALLAVRRGRWA